MSATFRPPHPVMCRNVKDQDYDGVVLVCDGITSLPEIAKCLHAPLSKLYQVDQASKDDVVFIKTSAIPSKRLIYSPTGPVNRDYDDVRRFADAAVKGIKRALKAGCKKPLLVCPQSSQFAHAQLVATLAALHALYVPLEIREDVPKKATKVDALGVLFSELTEATVKLLLTVYDLESGRNVARDIGGSDPERMAAPAAASYIQDIFKDTCIKVTVLSDPEVLKKEYPLLAAVNRAANEVERHRARVVLLEYEPQDTASSVDTTLLLVGKGITYDTGGLDIKAGGCMAGMHRDKCGAATVTGFFQVLADTVPKGLKVFGALAFVRNSVSAEGYVSDEIITSRAGVRVRIGNTDAEGRLVMTDLLCQMKEKALNAVNPELFTIATLTGHSIRAMGPNYSIVMDNGPARYKNTAHRLFDKGEKYGDPFEISTIRREDYEFANGPSEYEDLLSCNNEPSSATSRGHQFPAAFMIRASGLDKHGLDSTYPLAYSHMDIAGSSGPFPGIPTGAPLIALAAEYILNREIH